MRCKEAIFIGSTWSKWLPIDVATASHQENVLTIINLKTPEGIYGDWTFEQVIGSPIDQENNDGDKSSNNQVAKRWTCKDNMTEKLIEMILSYKSSEKYEGVDFESDLVKIYSDIRKMMAELHPSANFGPDITSYKKTRKF